MQIGPDRQKRIDKLQAAGVDIDGLLFAVDHKRAEIAHDQGKPVQPKQQPIETGIPEYYQVKIWPWVGVAAWHNKQGGAWRVWAIAGSLDKAGSGRVSRSKLWHYLSILGVGERKRRRWISEALRLGYMRFDQTNDNYYLASLPKAAVIAGAVKVGLPLHIDARELVNSGWRAAVWSKLIASLNGRPFSRAQLYNLTGIPERTQLFLENQSVIIYRKNYVKTGIKSDKLAGFAEHNRDTAFIGLDGFIYYRVADIRLSPIERTLCKGRSKKAQKIVNLSFYEERDPGQFYKLFHDTTKGAKGTIRAINDNKPGTKPSEIFTLAHAGRNNNVWLPWEVDPVVM